MLIVAVSVGAALGWIAGDAIIQSRPDSRFALILLVLAIIVLGLFFPLSAIAQICIGWS